MPSVDLYTEDYKIPQNLMKFYQHKNVNTLLRKTNPMIPAASCVKNMMDKHMENYKNRY